MNLTEADAFYKSSVRVDAATPSLASGSGAEPVAAMSLVEWCYEHLTRNVKFTPKPNTRCWVYWWNERVAETGGCRKPEANAGEERWGVW